MTANPGGADRYVRACERHMVPLETLNDGRMRCLGPAPHYATRWIVVDRLLERVLNRADVDGHKEELNMGLNAAAATKTKRQQHQLATKRFDKDGQVLNLQLRRAKAGGDEHRFRVCWTLRDATSKGVRGPETSGTSAAHPDEKAGRASFDDACRALVKAGWQEIERGLGLRGRLVIRPLPLEGRPLPLEGARAGGAGTGKRRS